MEIPKELAIIASLAFLIIIFPFLSPGIPYGHDILTHLINSSQFAKAFFEGDFPVRWADNVFPGTGSPTFNYYQPLFYYLFSILKAVGLSSVLSFKFLLFLLWGMSGVWMFLFAGKYFGKLAGLAAAFFYMLAPYHISQVFVRAALPEFTATAFAVGVFWALRSFWEKPTFRYFAISALLFGLFLLSHNLSVIVFLTFFLAYLGYLTYEFKSGKLLFLSLLSLILGGGLALFSWLPSVLEMNFVYIAIDKYGTNFHEHFICFSQLFSTDWGYAGSLAGCRDGMSFQLGIAHWVVVIVLVILLIFTSKSRSLRQRISREQLVLLTLFLVFLALSLFLTLSFAEYVWDSIPVFAFVQFPWRFLSSAMFAASFLVGGIFIFVKGKKGKLLLYSIMIALAFFSYRSYLQPAYYLDEASVNFNNSSFLQQYKTELEKQFSGTGGFTPIWVKELPKLTKIPAGEVEILTGEVSVVHSNIRTTLKEYSLAVSEDALIRFHTRYFPGWEVWVDGKISNPDYSNKFGLMEVFLPSGEHQVILNFKDTPVRSVSNNISVFSIILIAGLILFGGTRGLKEDRDKVLVRKKV